MSEIYTMPDGIQTRWSTAENPRGERGAGGAGTDGRKRKPFVPLPAHSSHVVAEATGQCGTIRRIWITIDDRSEEMLRGIWIEMYWDGCETAAVRVPIGEFFGHGLGRMATFENEYFSSPEGRSFNCVIPMPFRTGMRVVVVNSTSRDLSMLFYEVDYTLGDPHGNDVLYFHSIWRRETSTTPRSDFEILPRTVGAGRFLGTMMSVIAHSQIYFKSWWGEGEVKVYLDGDREFPTLCGTGTEDYIGTGWGQGQYAQRYQGCTTADYEKMQYAFYRFHGPDPVYFREEIRVTIQQIGCWDPGSMEQMHGAGLQLEHGDTPVDMQAGLDAKGYGLFERKDDWSSVAYFYLNQP